MQGRALRRGVPIGIPAALWRRVRAAPHRLLMLDYDGTLAPYTKDRDRAWPLPVALKRVRTLSESSRTTLAIVSGRPLDELERLIGLPSLTMIGEHGWDEQLAGRKRRRHRLPAVAAAALARAETAARELGWGRHLEHKRTALVLHTRGLPTRTARSLEAKAKQAWTPIARPGAVTLVPTNGGIELRARGRDKGIAVRSLIGRAPRGTLAVFVGDDITDEDAFAVVREHGIGVRVGQGRRPSLATDRLADCEAVADFLGRWLRVTTA